MRGYGLIAAVAIALSGCGQLSPRMAADTPEAFVSSMRQYVSEATWKTAQDRQELMEALTALYLTEDGAEWKPVEAEEHPEARFHGLRQADFQTMAYRVLNRQTEDDELFQVHPSGDDDVLARSLDNKFFLRQLKLQQGILLRRKERSRQNDLFTIDQLAFAEATFIPPQDGQPLAEDYARFSVKMLNNTVFNLYRPSFRVSVSDSRSPSPILDIVLTRDSDEPLVPGVVTQVTLECCDGFRAELTNHLLRTMEPDAKTSMHLVGIEDFRKRNVIENVIFSAKQHLQLVATERCINELEPTLDTWTAASSKGCVGI